MKPVISTIAFSKIGEGLEHLATGDVTGRLGIFAALAEFERELISERTKAGQLLKCNCQESSAQPAIKFISRLHEPSDRRFHCAVADPQQRYIAAR